ncbi:TrkA C-terminal domain-containing protein (plasmid) [Natrinema zhouii]|uniref:TrkA C-terminal domain-containing protein n=1 Tax=Natrinema zhouii TaxID=1710539 RepID=UPI001CFFFA06|nr:TrkA C-terminal domain-containing protein [Natrinema zhouii]UHQ98072.1 TrkA C-terminal domain-containing protein [Natrinema zhouii]
MTASGAIITLLLVFAVSLLIVRTGTVALMMTGMAQEVASFQAASAFSGAGFTTDETERVLATPQRRIIVKSLIRAGSFGIVTSIASLVLSFTRDGGDYTFRLISIIIGVIVIVMFARSRWFNQLITPGIEWAINRTTTLDFRDYTHLLDLHEDYRVAELQVKNDKWLIRGPLGNLNLDAEGVMILGINRQDGSYISPPDPNYTLQPGDTLTVYGQKERLIELSERTKDDETAHTEAIKDHNQNAENGRFPTYS